MSKRPYDVLVVGAGPGGSAAAISLAQTGWNVLLLDKASFPRDKVCGDFISPRSLRVLESLGCRAALDQARPNRLRSAALYLNGEQITAGEIPQVEDLPNYGYTLPRLVFDEILFRQVQASGVETVERCEVKGLTVAGDGVTLHAHHDGQPCDFYGQMVIAADGAHSTIARALGLERRDSKNNIVALRAYYDGVDGDPSQADIFFDQSYFPGYAWIFPTGEGRANVGLGMVMDVYQRYQINLRERLTAWVAQDRYAQIRLGKARFDGRISGWPLTTYQTAGGNYAERVLLVGDAGGFVDPINGEGIHTALESGCIAAAVADDALRACDLSAAFLARYEQQWRAAFDLDMRTSDLIVTLIKTRSLSGIWLLILKMIGQKAMVDQDYAATCGGILAGVVPTHRSLSPTIMAKTVLHGPDFWQRNLGLSLDHGLPGLLSTGLLAASGALDALHEMAQQPDQPAEWGMEVAKKGLGLLNSLGQEYSDDMTVRLFDAFFRVLPD